MKCPICGANVELSNPEMPFCGERCRTIDLGNWANEKYVISIPAESTVEGGAIPEEQDEDAE
jgi:endogenous inhibitor of DNA gyrase (YacG/DUF329 family)